MKDSILATSTFRTSKRGHKMAGLNTPFVDLSLFDTQKQLKKEVHTYRNYLQEQAEEEARREKELDDIVNAEVEKQWAKRAAQWRQEAQARKKLLQDVLQTRKLQIQEKCKEVASCLPDSFSGQYHHFFSQFDTVKQHFPDIKHPQNLNELLIQFYVAIGDYYYLAQHNLGIANIITKWVLSLRLIEQINN